MTPAPLPLSSPLRRPAPLWIIALLGLSITFVLANSRLQGPSCLFKALTHLPCPGCGLTRSMMALWHGRFWLSLHYHPLGLPLFGVAASYLALCLLCPVSPAARSLADNWTRALSHSRSLTVSAGLLISVWLLRLGWAFVTRQPVWW